MQTTLMRFFGQPLKTQETNEKYRHNNYLHKVKYRNIDNHFAHDVIRNIYVQEMCVKVPDSYQRLFQK